MPYLEKIEKAMIKEKISSEIINEMNFEHPQIMTRKML